MIRCPFCTKPIPDAFFLPRTTRGKQEGFICPAEICGEFVPLRQIKLGLTASVVGKEGVKMGKPARPPAKSKVKTK